MIIAVSANSIVRRRAVSAFSLKKRVNGFRKIMLCTQHFILQQWLTVYILTHLAASHFNCIFSCSKNAARIAISSSLALLVSRDLFAAFNNRGIRSILFPYFAYKWKLLFMYLVIFLAPILEIERLVLFQWGLVSVFYVARGRRPSTLCWGQLSEHDLTKPNILMDGSFRSME